MNIFKNIQPNDVTIKINELTNRIEATARIGNEFHEISFAEHSALNMQHILDELSHDLREE